MIPVYVSSSSRGSGKTSVIATVSVHLRQRGHKFAYIKPRTGKNTESDGDAGLMKQTFNLAESIEIMSPLVENGKSLLDSLNGILNSLDIDREVVFIEVPSKSNLDVENFVAPFL